MTYFVSVSVRKGIKLVNLESLTLETIPRPRMPCPSPGSRQPTSKNCGFSRSDLWENMEPDPNLKPTLTNPSFYKRRMILHLSSYSFGFVSTYNSERRSFLFLLGDQCLAGGPADPDLQGLGWHHPRLLLIHYLLEICKLNFRFHGSRLYVYEVFTHFI